MYPRTISCVAICLLTLTVARAAMAGWLVDGSPVRATSALELWPAIASDGAGGAVVLWADTRATGTETDLYAQRIAETGAFLWQAGGVVVCAAPGDQSGLIPVADGAGGVIVAWNDVRAGVIHVYAQRIDAGGNVLWAADGAPVCTTTAAYSYVRAVAPDGLGGIVIALEDYRGPDAPDIYAQRLDASGARLWGVNGVPVAVAVNYQSYPALMSDGAGGAYLAWSDRRIDLYSDVYAQRLDAAGNPKWTVNGIPICTAPFGNPSVAVVADGAGGAIFVYDDVRTDTSVDIYAQRVDSLGTTLWTADGAPVATQSHSEENPLCVSDGAGGAIIAFWDNRSGQSDVYAQRIDAGGNVLWNPNGVAICDAPDYQYLQSVVSDGAGGMMLAWEDRRSGTSYDVYAQRLDGSGAMLWAANGVELSGAVNNQTGPVLAATGTGSAIVAWEDFRGGVDYDIYAQRVQNGNWGYPTPAILSILDVPNDQGGWVRMRFSPSDWDVAEASTPVSTYGVWRRIDGAAVTVAAAGARQTDDLDVILRGVPAVERSGRVLLPPDAAAQAAGFPPGTWELVISVPAMQEPQYYVLLPTQADSSAAGTNDNAFVLTAHTTIPSTWFITAPDSGHSVDNIVPTPPASLIVEHNAGGSVSLSWGASDAPDLDHYRVYRSEQADFTPSPGDLVHATTGVEWTDPVNEGWRYHYKVTAVDHSGNESEPVSSALVTGTADRALPTVLTLRQNVPNPFNPTTRIDFDLPVTAHVTLEIYNTRGQRVRVLIDRNIEAGSVSAFWDGTTDAGSGLASGVYFYRLVTPAGTLSRKMVLLR